MLVLVACCALVGCAETRTPAGAPPAERPLLGPPDPAGPTERGVFLEDPKGQVERIAAGGHFVAWSVRTPADRRRTDSDGRVGELPPITLPASSKIVIADERGGTTLSVDLGRRWVSDLRMIRGAGGSAEPQLAVRSCRSRSAKSCEDELLTLAEPLKVTGRSGGANATAAVEGRLDSGRRLDVAAPSGRSSCPPRLSVREQDGSRRVLPPLPKRDRVYKRCEGLNGRLIYGQYAFASVLREAPRRHAEAEFFYGIDLAAGPSARWAEVARPYRGTDGGAALGLGPAVTDRALFWETFDAVEETIYSLDQVALPRDLQQEPTADTPTTSEPVAPYTGNACDIAATDSAIYELANPRCALDYGSGTSGQIRRLVNPVFRPSGDG